MFYLPNDDPELRFVFTNKSVSTISSKLAPMLICFDKLYFWTTSYQPLCMWLINPSAYELPTVNVRIYQPYNLIILRNFQTTSYQPLCMWLINPFAYELPTINVRIYQPYNLIILKICINFFRSQVINAQFGTFFMLEFIPLRLFLLACTTRQKMMTHRISSILKFKMFSL
jgi:hypothetical protein